MIKVGDWVTQYYAGYWMVVDIKPKYAEETVNTEYEQYKKGDLIGKWVLMKKAFTPKMKFKLDSASCDGAWCKPVSTEIKQQIEQYFKDHPKDYEKFCCMPFENRPLVSNAWVNLTNGEVEQFEKAIASLPASFTAKEAMAIFEAKGLTHCFAKPPTNYLFSCNHIKWELNEDFDPIFTDPSLSKVESN